MEFAAAGLGALAGWSAFIPVLAGFVVGLHFLPLAPLLRDPLLATARSGADRSRVTRVGGSAAS